MAYQTNIFSPLDTTPDSASVHVLYAGNLADDDFMWIVECTIEEFQKMLNSPVNWVRDLSLLPDWQYIGTNKPAPAPVLLKHFTMRIQQREKDSLSDLITLQGISNTGIITVRASQASAVAGVQNLLVAQQRAAQQYASIDEQGLVVSEPPPKTKSPLSDFWDGIAYDSTNGPSYKKEYAVNVDLLDGRYYGHFEICKEGEFDEQGRLAQTAAFILALGSDPQGFTNMLNGLNQSAVYITTSGVAPGPGIAMQTNASSSTPQILYTSLDEDTAAACLVLDGPYTPPPTSPPASPPGSGGTGSVDNPVVKKYGVDDPGNASN